MGRPKQLIEIDGMALIRRAAIAALATAPCRLLVVLGGGAADAIFAAVSDLPVQRIDCPDWEEGMAASLRAGINALQDVDCDGVLLVLCDQPSLDQAHLRALHAAWLAAPTHASASAYADTIGAPALLPRAWFPELRALQADCGARDLLRERSGQVIAISAPSLAHDLNSPADLDRFDAR